MRLFCFIIWFQQINVKCDCCLMYKVRNNCMITEVSMFVLNSISNDILSLWEFEFSIDENIEFNEKDFDLRSRFDELENHFIFKFHNKLNIARINAIIDALKCAQLVLQFDSFMNLCAHEMTVSESAMKFDVFVSRELTSWFGKKAK